VLRDERVAAWLGATLGVLFSICFLTGLYSHIQQHPLSWLAVPRRPVLVAKLWVVWPRFLTFPPFRRLSDLVERAGLLALVGGGVFMVFSGIANIAQWYPWHFSFTAAHYSVAWIVMGAILAHLGAKWAITERALGRHRAKLPDADPVLGTVAEPPHDGLTRRGFLGTVAAASGVLTAVTVGQTLP
jgi:hypothetical protein